MCLLYKSIKYIISFIKTLKHIFSLFKLSKYFKFNLKKITLK